MRHILAGEKIHESSPLLLVQRLEGLWLLILLLIFLPNLVQAVQAVPESPHGVAHVLRICLVRSLKRWLLLKHVKPQHRVKSIQVHNVAVRSPLANSPCKGLPLKTPLLYLEAFGSS